MKLVIITPSFNAKDNINNVCLSIDAQTDTRWEHIIIDDVSDEDKKIDDTVLTKHENRKIIFNDEKKYALRNIIEVARQYQDDDDVIIGTVDGDDQLSNDAVIGWVLKAYEENPEIDVLWTAHEWDVNEKMNVSRPMPEKVDPYEYPWCASHFRTFRANLLKKVSDENFKDWDGMWFRRGYDQALMLPLLWVGRQRGYIEDVCYLFKLNSTSIPLQQRKELDIEQIRNTTYIRARGFTV